MPTVALLRTVTFSAHHHYGRSDRSPEWNRERFGAQRHPHRHDYRLEVEVEGTPDPETGFVVDLPTLDHLLGKVVSPLDNGDLNQAIPEIREGTMQPSTESLALWFWNRLSPQIPDGARLRRVRVWESGTLAGEVEG
jgi:6-pyruvoyltetrahydropterin/6-carboxytetrahydropterin synthase